jgi:hypothetical protein
MHMQRLAIDWSQLKAFVQHAVGFSMDAIHVIAGVVLLFAIAALLRTSVARPLPLFIVLVIEIINEASDFWSEIWPDLGAQAGEAVKDLILTMAVPTLIFLASRYRPQLFGYKSS